MRSPLLIGVTLALAALLGVLLLQFTGGAPAVEASGPGPARAVAPAAAPDVEIAEVDGPAQDGARRPVDEVAVAASAPEAERREAATREEEPVIVRVTLAMADGSAFNFAGHTVDANSWVASTDEVTSHTAEANAEGIAEFRFEESVHIDFVRFVPPREYGLAFAFVEDHIDLDPGDVYEPSLAITAGAELGGRVLDDFGATVPGARVHAYFEDSWSDLGDWNPGVIHAETGPDGRFLLPLLPPGSWGLAVEPDGWLQVDPPLEDLDDGRTWFELEVGDRVVGGDLTVTRLHRLKVTVVDGGGQPAPRAQVQLVPEELRSPSLELSEREERDEITAFLIDEVTVDDGARRLPWPYGAMAWTTNADGVVNVLGVSGTWKLRVRPQLGGAGGSHADVVVPLDLPAADQTVRLGSPLWTLTGRLVTGEQSVPVAGANLRLVRTAKASSTTVTRTNSDGRFSLEGLPPDGEFELNVAHNQFVSAQWTVVPSHGQDEEPRTFRVNPASGLDLRLVDTAGEPIKGKRLKLISGHPSRPLAPAEAELFESSMQRTTQRSSNRRGRFSFRPLPEGRYVVALLLPTSTGKLAPNGFPITKQEVYQTWELETEPVRQDIVCDLSGYAPPPPPQLAMIQGVVRDAASGRPLPYARVRLKGPKTSNWAITEETGEFQLWGPAGTFTLHAMAEGYLSRSVPEREYPQGESYHELQLQPGGHELVVRFRDANGAALPSVDVRFSDADGGELYCLVQRAEATSSWRSSYTVRDGALTFAAVNPGPLTLDLTIGGVPLVSETIEVFGGRSSQEALVELDETLEQLRERVRAALSSDED